MNKKKICVVTGSRADYGLLYWTMKAISQSESFILQVAVTGMHLSPEFGLTYQEIEKDGFSIDEKVELLLSSDTAVGVAKSSGLGVISFSDVFNRLKPDMILLLGDRFEILSAVIAALFTKIPIAHCHGGELTEGAFDESIRHSITKMSHVHFVSAEQYRKRVIQLGEDPAHVFNVGALGIEHMYKLKLMAREEFEKSIDFPLGKKSLLITYHPETLHSQSGEWQFGQILEALDEFPECNLIFTKPNADTEGRAIMKMIDNFVNAHTNAAAFTSLGQLRYLSAFKYVDGVIGNSSSGIIEAPSFKVGTVNIGDRQKGRIRSESIIDCATEKKSIIAAIRKLLDDDFKASLQHVINPYDRGPASEKIVDVLKNIQWEQIIKKRFFDINING